MIPFLVAWMQAAHATPQPEAYATTVRLVDSLYLEQEALQADALLQAAARGAARQVHWLFVDEAPGGVRLRHGDGRGLGGVSVTSIAELPSRLTDLEQLVLSSGDVGDVDVRLAILEGLTDGLDRFSRILSGDTLASFDTRLKGTQVGVGARLAWADDALLVTSVTPGGPAERAGLEPGDHVLRIDGRSTVNMTLSEVYRVTEGAEGSTAELVVRRGDNELSLSLVRAEVVVPNVTHRDLGDGIGYLHIEHVSQRTVHNVRQATAALKAAGSLTRGLVIDLRGNTGGSMKEAARSADQFLDEGLLLRTVGHDGQRVQNLQAEMRASDGGDELEVPVLILTDRRTASGSEILAGALLEHDRTALVGTRTYGKGTVQKIYTLDPQTRLKLTVARYLLAHDRRIETSGIVPDVLVAELELDAYGARLLHLDGAVPREQLVLAVKERAGWRNEPASPDVPLEVARRALLATEGLDRTSLLAALQVEAERSRQRQLERLTDALASRGIDWSPAPEGTTVELWPDAEVSLQAHEEPGDVVRVVATVTNRDALPLHRAMVELRCATLPPFDDIALPVGRLEPGATTTVETRIPLRAGTGPRQDRVDALLHAEGRPVLHAGSAMVRSAAHPRPIVAVDARLVPHGDEKGPKGHPVYRAEITVAHDGASPLTGVEVSFDSPDDPSLELLDRGARRPVIDAGSKERFDLTVERHPTRGRKPVPLTLHVDTERYGRLARWSLQLPLDGSVVHYEAPRISAPGLPLVADPGPLPLTLQVRDDGAIDHVRVYVDGRKTAWFDAEAAAKPLRPVVSLGPGSHRITIVARDDQGLVSELSYSVWGEEPASADADDEPQRP